MSQEGNPSQRATLRMLISRTFSILMCVWLVVQIWPVWLQRGPKTTAITGPVRPDGTVDYAAALNAECSVGLIPDQNAAVLLVRGMGPSVCDEVTAPAYFKELGIDPPPVDGQYLQTPEQLYPGDIESRLRLNDGIDEVMKSGWASTEHPRVTHWLTINERALERCIDGTQLNRFFEPLVRPPGGSLFDVLFPLVQRSRDISRLLSLRVMRHLHEQHFDEALADTRTMHRLSRLIAQHPMMIPQLVAYAHSAMACAADGEILNSGQVTRDQARRHREFLESLSPMPPTVDVIDHAERFQILDLVQHDFFGATSGVALLQPNVFLTTINEEIDTLVAALKVTDILSCIRTIQTANQKRNRQAQFSVLTMLKVVLDPRRGFPREIARTYARLLIAVPESYPVWRERAQIRHQLCIAGFILGEYHAAHGHYPESLDQLTPHDWDQVPIDVFTGEPIRYVFDAELNTILLYSVGENRRDDHGLMSGKNQADDIAFGAVPKE